jgi:hypothetical protein
MGEAGGFGYRARFEDGVEAGIAVSLEHAFEGLQVASRMLALAIGRVEEHRRRRTLALMRAFVADIGP